MAAALVIADHLARLLECGLYGLRGRKRRTQIGLELAVAHECATRALSSASAIDGRASSCEAVKHLAAQLLVGEQALHVGVAAQCQAQTAGQRHRAESGGVEPWFPLLALPGETGH